MISNVFADVPSPAAVRDIVLDPCTGSPHEVDEVDTIDDEFFAMIYSDEELLRAEFDALMAAAWPGAPTPARGPGAEQPPDGPRSDRPPVGGRLPRSVGAGCRTLAPRTRAPPDIGPAASPSPARL